MQRSSLTLGLIHPDDDHAFVPPDAHQFVDGTNAPPRQLAQHDHALDVVVLEQAYIRAHLRDGAHVHHHHVFQLRVAMLVEPTRERHLGFLARAFLAAGAGFLFHSRLKSQNRIGNTNKAVKTYTGIMYRCIMGGGVAIPVCCVLC